MHRGSAPYAAGVLWVGLVVAAFGWAAWVAQRRWVGVSDGPTAVLAAVVIALTAITAVGQLLGAAHLLTGWAVLVATVIVAAGAAVVQRSLPTQDAHGPTTDPPPAVSRLDIAVLAVAVGAVAAQWGAHLGDAYARGMVQADNLWYHGPFAARIVQTGSFESLAPFGYPESRYFPLNTHLLSAMLILPTDSDLLVPLLNHLAAGVALLAAWIIGRRRGVAALSTFAVLVVVSLPLVASTQPGQMYNDVAALALVVAGVALLLPTHAVSTDNSDASRVALLGGPETVIAFLAFGWALSAKLSVAVPVAVLVIGVVVGMLRAGRRRVALAACGGFVATGGVWFVRNLVLAQSPMPYTDLRIGPLGFEQHVPTLGTSLLSTLDDPRRWGSYYVESLDVSFGPLWMAVLAAALVGAVAGVVRSDGLERLTALAALVGMLAFPLMPATGELPFVNNLRYGLTPLVLGLIAGSSLLASHRRATVAVTAVAVVVVVANLASPHRGRVEAWPDQLLWAVAIAALAVVVVTGPMWWPRLIEWVSRPALLVAAVGVLVLVVAAIAAPAAERSYHAGRYDGTDLEDAALYAAVPDDAQVRVDVLNSVETYPFFGSELSNNVAVWNDELASLPAGADGASTCAEVRGWMVDPFGHGIDEGYVVVGQAWLMRPVTSEERAAWFGSDPAVIGVYDDGNEAVYARVGPLAPEACAR
jgi:hypothetical protein